MVPSLVLGVGGKPKVDYIYYLLEQGCCVEAQKQPQCTCQAKTVVGSSLTPHAALSVLPSGTVHPVVSCHEFTRSEKCCLRKQTWSSSALSLVCLDSAIECGFHVKL